MTKATAETLIERAVTAYIGQRYRVGASRQDAMRTAFSTLPLTLDQLAALANGEAEIVTTGEIPGHIWSKWRSAFQEEAERYAKHTKYEECAIQADGVPKRLWRMAFTAAPTSPEEDK